MPLSGRKSSFRTRDWVRHQRVALLALIGANVAVFVAQLVLEISQPGFARDYLGISDRGVREAYAWQFVTGGVIVFALVMICVSRGELVGHSCLLGGCAAGWLYAHLLGYGRISFLQRLVNRRQIEAERYRHMTVEQLMSEEIDPLLEKIA